MTELESPFLRIPSVSYFDVEAHYNINRMFTLGVGVNNIGDKVPPFIGTLELRTDAATYEVSGRTWHASLRVRFGGSSPPLPPPTARPPPPPPAMQPCPQASVIAT